MNKKRILSGMRPTDRLHLGNLFGALQNWVQLQDEYECFYMVADLHALTTEYENPTDIKANIKEILIDWLSAGIDYKKSTIFIQSNIPEHSELYTLLSMITPLPWVERCPTYKEQLREIKGRDLYTYGFLGYPVLQAADILLYKAEAVPVGEDQLPHLELTREIARRFNYFYGKIFPEPEAKLTYTPKVPGIDGRKMSKSYNNCIYISDTPEDIKIKVHKMITDPEKIKLNDIGHPEVCTVFQFHHIFNKDKVKEIENSCRAGKLGCVEDKNNLAEIMENKLKPLHIQRKFWEENSKRLDEIIEQGQERAQKVAQETIREVKRVMGI